MIRVARAKERTPILGGSGCVNAETGAMAPSALASKNRRRIVIRSLLRRQSTPINRRRVFRRDTG
ncbi:MAG: hypothetical protein ACREUS_07400 [Burkholderiales bacterium]